MPGHGDFQKSKNTFALPSLLLSVCVGVCVVLCRSCGRREKGKGKRRWMHAGRRGSRDAIRRKCDSVSWEKNVPSAECHPPYICHRIVTTPSFFFCLSWRERGVRTRRSLRGGGANGWRDVGFHILCGRRGRMLVIGSSNVLNSMTFRYIWLIT